MAKWFKQPGDASLPTRKASCCEGMKQQNHTHNEQDRTYLKDGKHAILHNSALEEEAAADGGRETTTGKGGEAMVV